MMHVFDCDGVLLDTNGVKGQAFYLTALALGGGHEQAEALREYHRSAGSIGRAARWQHYFANILRRPATEDEWQFAMEESTRLIVEGTITAPLLPGVTEYLSELPIGQSMCVSGIEDGELRQLLDARQLCGYFGAGVFGCKGKEDKTKLLMFLLQSHRIKLPAVYYGDTEDDLIASRRNGLEFIWVRAGSEWKGPNTIRDFRELLCAPL